MRKGHWRFLASGCFTFPSTHNGVSSGAGAICTQFVLPRELLFYSVGSVYARDERNISTIIAPGTVRVLWIRVNCIGASHPADLLFRWFPDKPGFLPFLPDNTPRRKPHQHVCHQGVAKLLRPLQLLRWFSHILMVMNNISS